jgi:chromosome partitioning protein
MKGGVGKTTIAALLGRYASIVMGLNVLAIDLDPQANLSQAYMGDARYRRFLNDKLPSIVEIFNGYQPPTPGMSAVSPLDVDDVIVRGTSLGGHNLALIPSRFDFSNNLIDSMKPDPRVLARLISSNFQDKDLILIDCAPTESIFTQAAYHASRYILVPVKPEYFATIGFPLLNDSLDAFRSHNRGHAIDVAGVVINNPTYDGGNDGGPEKRRSMREIQEESDQNGWQIFENEIRYSRGFPKMMRGDFTYQGNAAEYRDFAAEFFQSLGLPIKR